VASPQEVRSWVNEAGEKGSQACLSGFVMFWGVSGWPAVEVGIALVLAMFLITLGAATVAFPDEG
jgi:hypothetical protein